MTMRTNCILLLVILLGAFPLNRVHADESGSIILYTPYKCKSLGQRIAGQLEA